MNGFVSFLTGKVRNHLFPLVMYVYTLTNRLVESL